MPLLLPFVASLVIKFEWQISRLFERFSNWRYYFSSFKDVQSCLLLLPPSLLWAALLLLYTETDVFLPWIVKLFSCSLFTKFALFKEFLTFYGPSWFLVFLLKIEFGSDDVSVPERMRFWPSFLLCWLLTIDSEFLSVYSIWIIYFF